MGKRSSWAPYVLTVDSLDDPRLKRIREWVKFTNKLGGKQRRVSVCPRLGKDSPFAYLYGRGRGKRRHQWILQEHGARFDVYIHRRYAY